MLTEKQLETILFNLKIRGIEILPEQQIGLKSVLDDMLNWECWCYERTKCEYKKEGKCIK